MSGLCDMALPVAGKVFGLAALQRVAGKLLHLLAIGDAAVILPP